LIGVLAVIVMLILACAIDISSGQGMVDVLCAAFGAQIGAVTPVGCGHALQFLAEPVALCHGLILA